MSELLIGKYVGRMISRALRGRPELCWARIEAARGLKRAVRRGDPAAIACLERLAVKLGW